MKQLMILEPADLEAINLDPTQCRGNYLVLENSCVLVATTRRGVASLHKLAHDVIDQPGVDEDFTKAILRLRASQAESNVESFQDGVQFGREWATSDAQTAELRRLADLHEQLGSEWEQYFLSDRQLAAHERLFFELQPDCGGDECRAAEFWSFMLRDCGLHRLRDANWLRGFAEGALAVWWQVMEKI